ncbi:MAG TPA: response regulator transcription factor [Acidisoma sp.]|jgi:two-component system phosphate regulon response regulator OmpR|uniref:response regulator transcription factor n=1 Tax=Acidisoma sp. TaxID=1872115 RepID=UPI002CF7C8C9|nr:response regulator transcription factor [Acidisoma sp.]HTI01640.1 response regulator transcription factor [Acidisoma sp.]
MSASQPAAPDGTLNAHVLVVDDDERLRRLLVRYLTDHGFRVTAAADAAEARASLRSLRPDLMILDVTMPGETGLELVDDLRRRGDPELPVLLLTARGAPEDRIAGFEAGADDYLGKPFDPYELVLRARALLRRAGAVAPGAATVDAGPVRLGDAEFDPARGELRNALGPIRLTGGEIALLTALAQKPNEILSREEIAEALGMEEPGERAIDVQVTRLRRKIERDSREPRFLHTVRGRGYVLKPGI